jgi:hypothetical protein
MTDDFQIVGWQGIHFCSFITHLLWLGPALTEVLMTSASALSEWSYLISPFTKSGNYILYLPTKTTNL